MWEHYCPTFTIFSQKQYTVRLNESEGQMYLVNSLNTSVCAVLCSLVSVVSDSLWPCGLLPAKLLCPWDSSGENTGAGCHALLQGDLPDLWIEPISLASPALQAGSLPTELPRTPIKSDISTDYMNTISEHCRSHVVNLKLQSQQFLIYII